MPEAPGLSEIHEELVLIKRLLLVALQRTGASQGELATALGMNQSTVSRMLTGARKGAASRRGKE